MEQMKCSAKQLEVPSDLKQKFEAIRKQMSENGQELANLGMPIAYLGKAQEAVSPYEGLKDKMTAEEYFKYLCQLIDSPEDIYKIINEPFMKWKPDRAEDEIPDQLNEADVTIANGGGDCDNLSLVAKKLFEALSCKTGFDYKARIIGLGEHAVCVYTDKDGKMYSIDQHRTVEPFTDIYEASEEFPKRESGDVPREVFLENNGGMQLMISQDPDSLEKTYDFIHVRFKSAYNKKFDFQKLLPKDWKKYVSTQVYFGKNEVIFYDYGVLRQQNFADGIHVKYKGPDYYQKVYPGGDLLSEFFTNEKLSQRNFRDGKSEIYDAQTGGIKQINWPNGNIEVFKKGKLYSKDFPEGNDVHSEFYDENGLVIQRNFRNKKLPHKVEWYKNNQVIQTKNWDDQVTSKYLH